MNIATEKLNNITDRAECIASLALASSTIRDGFTLDESQRLDVVDGLTSAIRFLAEKLAEDAANLGVV